MAAASKASILTFASAAWNTTFSGTTLDEAIKATLGDLNTSELLTDWDESQTLVSGGTSLAYPTNYKSVISIQLASSTGYKYDPLIELPGGMRALKQLIYGTSPTGIPTHFVEDIDQEKFLLYLPANGAYTTEINFWAEHPLDADGIIYPSKFQHLLNVGATYWLAVLRRNKEYINHWGQVYASTRQRMESQVAPTARGAYA